MIDAGANSREDGGTIMISSGLSDDQPAKWRAAYRIARVEMGWHRMPREREDLLNRLRWKACDEALIRVAMKCVGDRVSARLARKARGGDGQVWTLSEWWRVRTSRLTGMIVGPVDDKQRYDLRP